jgi:hypothetical protein
MTFPCPDHGQVLHEGCYHCDRAYQGLFCKHPNMDAPAGPGSANAVQCPDCDVVYYFLEKVLDEP